MKEVWKEIGKNRRFRFEISTEGNLRLIDFYGNTKLVDKRINKQGYYYYGYRINPVHTQLAHRLVAIAFIPNPLNLPEVNHKDENPQNNFVLNLEWCDHTYNCRYGTRVARVTAKIIKPVCQLTKEGELIKIWESAATAERYYRPNKKRCGNISNCCTGKHKTAFGYKWKYMEEI